MKKVGIVGARIYTNKLKVKEFVFNLKEKFGDDVEIVSGGQMRGADGYAKKFALEFDMKYVEFPPRHYTYNQHCILDRDNDHAQFTWYNIIHGEDKDVMYPCRFQYEHDNGWKLSGVLNGLEQFRDCLKFVTSPKPPRQDKPIKRKQKRNDYED